MELERSPSPSNVSQINNCHNDHSNDGQPSDENNENKNNNNNQSNNNHLITPRSDSPKPSPTSDDMDMEDSDINNDFRSPSPDTRRELSFPMVPNSMFSHSIMYMSHYIPTAMGQNNNNNNNHHNNTSPINSIGPSGLNLSSLSNDERRKRNRTFIDPVTEVPKLEQWFAMNTHPSHNLILKYTEDLNRMPYR